MPRLGVLAMSGGYMWHTSVAFSQGLQEHGYFHGRNIAVDFRVALAESGDVDRVVTELVGSGVGVIVAGGDLVALAARRRAPGIPLVFVDVGDPVALGLAASLARPGGNATGLSSSSPDLSAKRLELLREVVPGARRVAALRNPSNPATALLSRETDAAAQKLGLPLGFVDAGDFGGLEAAFAAMARDRVEALVVLPDPVFLRYQGRLAELAIRHRIPAVFEQREHAETGGLLAYGASVPDLYLRAAAYFDKILKGARPGTLPVEQPTRFELVVNLRTARALGLTLPPALLLRADHVIE
jgi:putative ABC transport system substrate-binding protein